MATTNYKSLQNCSGKFYKRVGQYWLQYLFNKGYIVVLKTLYVQNYTFIHFELLPIRLLFTFWRANTCSILSFQLNNNNLNFCKGFTLYFNVQYCKLYLSLTNFRVGQSGRLLFCTIVWLLRVPIAHLMKSSLFCNNNII